MSQRHSYSSIAQFRKCPLSYYFKYIINLEPRDAEANSHHLAFGKAGHAGLEWLYARDYANDSSITSGVTSKSILLSNACGALYNEYPIQLDPNDRAKTSDNGMLMLKLYVNRWAQEDSRWRVLSVESLDTSDTSPLDVLRLDLVMENLDTGGIYGFDHKITGKSLGPWFWEQFNPNSQITHYIDHVQERFGSCEGFIINAISLQWRDEKKSNDASNVEWFDPSDPLRPWLAYSHHEERPYKGTRFKGVGIKKDTPLIAAWGLTVQFERQVFNRTESQIQQERASTNYWKLQIEAAEDIMRDIDAEELGLTEAERQEVAVYGFNTASCTFCEYRGGDVQGGICRPGYEWPRDKELILLSYRQACRNVIQVECSRCQGKGADFAALDEIFRLIKQDCNPNWIGSGEPILKELPVCGSCGGNGSIPGPRCALDRGHVDACSETRPVEDVGDEIVVEVSE